MAYLDEPPGTVGGPNELLDSYLDYYRGTVLRKLDGLCEEELRGSRLPSGWTPLALLVHLTWMERRWFNWGFAAEPTERPWGDQGPDGAWQVPAGASVADVRAAFAAQCERSRAAVAGVPLERRAATGGRFATPTEAPTLAWIKLHVLQEYARHAGHLDIVRELADGVTGE
jgi:uncharacterized protein DUF664